MFIPNAVTNDTFNFNGTCVNWKLNGILSPYKRIMTNLTIDFQIDGSIEIRIKFKDERLHINRGLTEFLFVFECRYKSLG